MYPNPQDVLPLPPRPSVEQYRTRAKELVSAHKAGPEAVEAWSTRWIEALWRMQSTDTTAPDSVSRNALARDHERSAKHVAAFAIERLSGDQGALSQAQFVMARAHGFPSWARLVAHLEAMAQERSEYARFERAVDAIVSGDLEELNRLLRDDASLVLAHSDRAHGATLLHYVSANGVENYRQRTPSNIVAIATCLLDAGANVRATCDVYGGGADTLGLVITSAHPRAAGVQLTLADLLISRGAEFGTGTVRGCLANGCPEAAAHMASLCIARGIPLDLQELAGVGQTDMLAAVLSDRTPAPAEAGEALGMAGWYNQAESIRTLVRHGVSVDTTNGDGATALHVSSYAGQSELVQLLLSLGANVHQIDRQYRTTPMVWALHAWLVDNKQPAAAYPTIVSLLLDAGALVKPDWVDDDRVRADYALYARLMERAQQS
ncbi:MAG: ankyrin repeat domain-containing protein [Gemmatimonadaceae bacterium]|nr:ankyrin repeat domain-containing protein [Gemmatimonadaceae bacterium]